MAVDAEAADCKAVLLERLQAVVDETAKGDTARARIKFPAHIAFETNGPDLATVRMDIGPHASEVTRVPCVTDNMQQDAAAFEGWAMVIKTRLPEVQRIELIWKMPDDLQNRHYQRFLYRVHKFEEIFRPWLTVAQTYRDQMRIKLGSGAKYSLNVPGKERVWDATTEIGEGERDVEQRFVQEGPLKESLKQLASVDVLGNQLPVGLFDGVVSGKTGAAIFTGQASAIDLWGVDGHRSVLSVFELKLGKNRKVGVLSELFFYAMVMRDLIQERFSFDDKKKPRKITVWPPDYINKEIKAIRAYILSPRLHPLINAEVLTAMTTAAKEKGMDVAFNQIAYDLNKSTCRHGDAWHDA